MSNEQIKGNLEQIKGKIKQKWGQLTDDDLDSLKGNWDQLAGKLTERYGMTKEQASQTANEFLKSIKGIMNSNGEGSNMGDLGAIKEQVQETVEHAKENLAAASDKLMCYVKENPVTAMAIALASGAVLAMLLRR
jgi:uncharacterized protein YjbJ (UPF0337 family)